MATMTAGQFLTLMEPGLDKVWHDEGTPRPLQYTQVFNVSSFDKLFIEQAKMAGFGPLQPQGEGENVIYDEAIAPITKRWDYEVYALAYRITDKLIRNEQYGQVELLERDLRRSADDTTETYAMAILNNAHNTTIASGFDGLALASNAHTRLDGGATQDNYGDAALSLTALNDMLIAFRKLKNDRGRPFTYSPRKLFIAADLMLTAEELLGSELKPRVTTVSGSDDRNAINVVGRFGLQPIVLDYLTSTTFWAAVADKHDLRFAWRFKAEIDNTVDFENNTIKRKTRQGMLRGFGEWRGFYLGND
jgi:hypothetical protein